MRQCKKRGQYMRIYSKERLACAAIAFLNVLIQIGRALEGSSWDITMAVLWGIVGLVSLGFAFDLEQSEKDRRRAEWDWLASRELFGRWRFLAEWFGYGLLLFSMICVFTVPVTGICLMLAGTAYTVVNFVVIRRRAERMRTKKARGGAAG